jgi:rhamnose transport system ATP-binding protein
MGGTRSSACVSRGSVGNVGDVPDLLLEASSIAKSFSGVDALKGVSFDLRAGEVHAMVGENGAGKSTLIRIITGAESPDAGTLSISGQHVRHIDPAIARRLEIAAIYQQPSLFPDLTVAENIALALEPERLWRRVDWAARRRRAAFLLGEIGASIDPERLVASLSMPEQQMVEIAKAIGAEARIVIMDEPTASLTDREVERLFGIIGVMRKRDVGVIYISHRLEEVLAIADRITVLRDGRVAGTCDPASVNVAGLVRLMVGRDLAAINPKRAVAIGPVVLEIRHLSNPAVGLRDVSLDVGSGEILGLAGLVGSGRTELAESVFGLIPGAVGDIRLRGESVRIETPEQAIRMGVAYLPEDRPHHGVVAQMAIAANVTFASLNAFSNWGVIDRTAERASAQRYVERLRIKAPSVSTPVEALSGGNQQKVALARWLETRPAVLILDEPTQGVDVGSKAEIHALIQDLAEHGRAIMMISSELPEILGMSDRIAVMHAGMLVATMSRGSATQESILAHALGHAAAGTPSDEHLESPSS